MTPFSPQPLLRDRHFSDMATVIRASRASTSGGWRAVEREDVARCLNGSIDQPRDLGGAEHKSSVACRNHCRRCSVLGVCVLCWPPQTRRVLSYEGDDVVEPAESHAPFSGWSDPRRRRSISSGAAPIQPARHGVVRQAGGQKIPVETAPRHRRYGCSGANDAGA